MRISDWSSDVCSSDLRLLPDPDLALGLPRQPALRRDRPAPRRQGAREAGELRRDLPAHRRPAAGQAGAGAPGLPPGRAEALERAPWHPDHSAAGALSRRRADRTSVVSGKRVSVRVDLGGRRIIQKTYTIMIQPTSNIQALYTLI